MYKSILSKAFPTFLQDEVLRSLEQINPPGEIEHYRGFFVTLKGERLEIPQRIYFEEPGEFPSDHTEALILNCLMTRHHDGFIREKYLRKILSANEYWTAPFIMQLLGEYVIQILEVIEKQLNTLQLENLRSLADEDPLFYELTKSRVTSYWNCYYRYKFPKRKDYAGDKILTMIESGLPRNYS